MRDKHITQLETRLEQLIEGAFAHLLGRKVRAQDVALHLARAMESGLRRADTDGDPRPFAPTHYYVYLHPDVAHRLIEQQPSLAEKLSQHMVEMATYSDYRLDAPPQIVIEGRSDIVKGKVHVTSQNNHAIVANPHATHAMQRVTLSQAPDVEQIIQAQLIIETRSIPLNTTFLRIGRSLDNDIVLDDAHVSRYHAQLRLRFGRYTLFDAQSRSGTFVNNMPIREQTLLSGDIVQIGNNRLIYIEEGESPINTTHQMPPITPEDTHT